MTVRKCGEACAANPLAVVIRATVSFVGWWTGGSRWGVNRKRLVILREQEMFWDLNSHSFAMLSNHEAKTLSKENVAAPWRRKASNVRNFCSLCEKAR